MSILAVSDEIDERLLAATQPERLSGVRLIVSCGDLPTDYLEALVDRFGAPLLYVRGNHDLRFRENPPPGDDIHGRVVIVAGLRVLGFEGSMWYNGEGVQYTEREMWWRAMLARPAVWRRRGVDLIVTHAPPHGLHDGPDLAHTGFRTFRRLVETLCPRYFIHGHIHLAYAARGARIAQVGDTQVVNAFRSILLPVEITSRRPA